MAQRRHIIGTKVRDLRETRGVGAGDLASRVGISASYFTRIEQGARRPRPPVIARIATALGVTVEDITSLDDAA